MKNRLCRMVFGLLCLLMLAGCGKPKTEEDASLLYRFGDAEVVFGEYFIYARIVDEDYQRIYGSGIWGLELAGEAGKSTVEEVTRQDIISDINRVKVLSAKAKELNITLTDKEEAEASQPADNFYDGLTEEDLKESGITKELVNQVLHENMLARRVYDQMIAEYDFEISEEEARMTTFYDIVFECYSVQKDGTVKEYTDEKKAAQHERANEALASLAQDEGVNTESIVKKYHLEFSDSYTMSKTELIETYGESVANRIMELPDGKYSSVVSSQYGYHIFKMIKSNNEELTKKNKEETIAAKQKEYFNSLYEEWLKEYDAHFHADKDVNQELAAKYVFSR